MDGASGSASELLAPALRTLLAPSLRSLASSCPAPAVVGADATLVEAAKAMLSPGVTAVLVRCPEGADGGAGGGAGGGKGSGGGAADAGSPDEQRFSLLTPRSLLEAVAEGDAAALASSALDGQAARSCCCRRATALFSTLSICCRQNGARMPSS